MIDLFSVFFHPFLKVFSFEENYATLKMCLLYSPRDFDSTFQVFRNKIPQPEILQSLHFQTGSGQSSSEIMSVFLALVKSKLHKYAVISCIIIKQVNSPFLFLFFWLIGLLALQTYYFVVYSQRSFNFALACCQFCINCCNTVVFQFLAWMHSALIKIASK